MHLEGAIERFGQVSRVPQATTIAERAVGGNSQRSVNNRRGIRGGGVYLHASTFQDLIFPDCFRDQILVVVELSPSWEKVMAFI